MGGKKTGVALTVCLQYLAHPPHLRLLLSPSYNKQCF